MFGVEGLSYSWATIIIAVAVLLILVVVGYYAWKRYNTASFSNFQTGGNMPQWQMGARDAGEDDEDILGFKDAGAAEGSYPEVEDEMLM